MMNKKTIKMIYTMLALTVLFPSLAWAQNPDVAAEARNAINRTDEIISLAKEIVQECRSQKARLALERAIEIQHRAMNLSVSNRNSYALKITMEARQEAWHAIALARAESRMEEAAQRLDEDTMERLTRLRSRIMENGLKDNQTLKLIEEAKALLERSRINAHQYRNQLAFKLAENAYKLILKAEERFRKTRNLKEMCERRLILMERLLDRAREQQQESDDPRIKRQFQLAAGQLERSREQLAAGRYRAAQITLEKCETVLRSLVRQVQSDHSSDAEKMFSETLRLRERAAELIGGDPHPATQKFLNRADKLLEQARQAVNDGRSQNAVELTKRARTLLRQAIDSSPQTISRDKLSAEIESALQRRDNLLETLENCTEPGARDLFQRASRRLDNAQQLFAQERFERAAAELKIARNLFNRIREICSS
ncbi:MAG: hypothetical protein JXB45_10445 [Candidatus Krumholzibacteriota bacterium]|nr:hypothetical protein [Candidatus Krumholzibacteriota bacterium]